jgi:hypothetical protein
MNQYDLNNYNFLLYASKEQFDNWCNHATPDDFDYALELFKAKRMYDYIDSDNIKNLDLSRSVLKQFTLKG